MESGVNCKDCMAACCRAGNRYSLTREEAKVMNLTSAHEIYSPYGDLMTDRLPVYELKEDCTNLVENEIEENAPEFSCGLYDDPARPGCCTFIKPGGEYCLDARRKAGYVDAPNHEEFVCAVPPSSE